MPADEIKKPSLTQRKKSSGSASLSSITSSSTVKTPSPIKLTSSAFGKPESTEPVKSEDDISIGKVILVIVAVVIVAVVAAFLVQSLQSPGDDTIGDDTETTPTPTDETTPTPTDDVDETPTPTPTPSVTPTTETPTDENTDNEFGKTTQYLAGGLTGNVARIRTYQFENTSSYYEFRLPFDDGNGGEIDVPNVKAEYNDAGDLVVELKNIKTFTSCNYLNDNNDNMGYDNVVTVTCTPAAGMFTFTFDTLEETDFRVTTGTAEVSGEDVDAVVVQIKNR